MLTKSAMSESGFGGEGDHAEANLRLGGQYESGGSRKVGVGGICASVWSRTTGPSGRGSAPQLHACAITLHMHVHNTAWHTGAASFILLPDQIFTLYC